MAQCGLAKFVPPALEVGVDSETGLMVVARLDDVAPRLAGRGDGTCQLKRERKGDASLPEVKCKDGYGARWRGE